MKIVHFAEYASGGVATYIQNLVSSQAENPDISQIIIYCSDTNSNLQNFKFKSNKIRVLSYPYKRGLSGVFKILMMKKSIMAENPDIIHVHSTFAGLIRIMYLFSKNKNKIIYCAHGWSFNKQTSNLKKMLYKVVEKILSYGCFKIVNISKDESESANFIKQSKMVTIYNSIPDILLDSTKIISNKRQLIFIGRFDKQKGVDLLLDALDSVKLNSLKITVVGDVVLNQHSDFKKKNMANVNFVGWKNSEDINGLLQDSAALVMPSRWEGFGLTALEAMRSSRMVIASTAGALPELVVDNYNGIIFDKNSITSLRNALLKFSRMTAKDITTLGNNGREVYLSRFNYDNMIYQLNSLYSEVISKY